MEVSDDLNIIESFLVDRITEDDDFHEYMEELWIETERQRHTSQRPYFNFPMELANISLQYCTQYFKSFIEIPKIILDNIRYHFSDK